jgi:hypothetical protein
MRFTSILFARGFESSRGWRIEVWVFEYFGWASTRMRRTNDANSLVLLLCLWQNKYVKGNLTR